MDRVNIKQYYLIRWEDTMHHSMYDENQVNEENEIMDEEMAIDLGGIPENIAYPHSPERIRYYLAETALKEISRRLNLLTKADNSLIDKKFHKKILKRELNKYIFYLNASQLENFMENNRTFLARAEQMFKLCDK